VEADVGDFDLVIRSGTVVDGTGGDPREADVAVRGGVIAAVGEVPGRGKREIDAGGAIVTPGFVDIHTHYDGQAVWDDRLQPSSWHGVTTVVAGNCGVGFAPVRPEHRDSLIQLMEGVEDIPGTALHEGLSWNWTSFAEYLDVLDSRPRDVDLATQVPHAPLRFYAMGERAAAHEQATEAEMAIMAELVGEAIEAGALGFTTSRTLAHKSISGELTPTYGSAHRELGKIAVALRRAGTGVLQLITDYDDVDEDFALMRELVKISRRPLSVSLYQKRDAPEQYRKVLDELTAANQAGLPIKAQVAPRCMGIMLGLQCAVHPFMMNPVWRTLAHLPVAEQARRMSDASMRAAILAAQTDEKDPNIAGGARADRYDAMHVLGAEPDYEPDSDDALLYQGRRTGRAPEDIAYDALIADEGRGLIYQPFSNYAWGNLDAVREMLVHAHTIPGLGDGGAHVGSICDASFPTTLVQLWARDRATGRLELPYVIRRQARDTAEAVGLRDRGQLRPGFKADINVIDLTALRVHSPWMAHDLPTGGRRLLQRAEGYRYTIVSGVETYRDGVPTRELPGRVVRGARPHPDSARDAA
jgi:N-acyl-D-aspartate/D-glutamate deacylase